jgi:hypothetical protein
MATAPKKISPPGTKNEKIAFRNTEPPSLKASIPFWEKEHRIKGLMCQGLEKGGIKGRSRNYAISHPKQNINMLFGGEMHKNMTHQRSMVCRFLP